MIKLIYDVVMLLLLGDASLMIRVDSVLDTYD